MEISRNTEATTAAMLPSPMNIQVKKKSAIKHLLQHRALYIMLIPGLLYLLIFRYVPLLGSFIAFQDYNIFKGFLHSDWVGFKWFIQLFTYPQIKQVIWNTFVISFYQIVFAFPAPIILAILMNEVRHLMPKKIIQTIVYMPHFLSWPIIFGLAYMMLSPQSGLINQVVVWAGYEPINFLIKADYFRTIIIVSGVWKDAGWSAIIFLAALVGISPILYEAAKIDGAGRWKQFLNITIPGLMPAIVILLLLKIGNVLELGFDQIYIFLTPATLGVGDVLDTFTYRAGIINGQYSLTTAIGLFKSVIGFVLLVVANRMSKATSGEGLY